MAVGAGIGGMNDQSSIRKQGIYEVGNSREDVLEQLKNWKNNNLLTDQQYNDRVSTANTMADVVAKVNIVTKKDGTPLTYDEKAELAAQQFRIRHNEKIKADAALESQKQSVDADNKEAIAEQQAILDDAPLYKVNGVVVDKVAAKAAIESSDTSVPVEVKNDPEMLALLNKNRYDVKETPQQATVESAIIEVNGKT